MAFHEFTNLRRLYHYTSVEAFKLIASSGLVRLSRADQTNDPFEVAFVRSVLLGFLNFMIDNESDGEQKGFWKRTLQSYETVSDPAKFYISCWSSRCDSIPMWRLYSGEGRGVVFALRPRAFSGFDCRLTKVDYLDESQEMLEHVRKYAKLAYGEHLDLPGETGHIPLIVRLIEATLSTKRIEWDYESEFRLSFSFNEEKYESIKEHVNASIFARMSKYEPNTVKEQEDRQFVFQPFGKRTGKGIDRSQAIPKLYIGPNCDWSPEDANSFLKDLGYRNFEVQVSEVRWR